MSLFLSVKLLVDHLRCVLSPNFGVKSGQRVGGTSDRMAVRIDVPGERRHLSVAADFHYFHRRESGLNHPSNGRVAAIVESEAVNARHLASSRETPLHAVCDAENQPFRVWRRGRLQGL